MKNDKNDKTERRQLKLDTETLRVLNAHDLEDVAGAQGHGEGQDGEGFWPTNGCRTIIGSFNGNCCNTKQA